MIQGYTLFWIFQKGSGTSFYSTFCAIFFKKNISCYILLTDQISFSDCLYFSKYLAMYIVNVSFPVCDIKNFEIYLSFLINRFPTWPRSQNKISKLETALGAIKSIFYHFQRYSAARNVLRSESAPLIKCRRGCFSILLIFFILRQLPMNLSLLISNIYIYICYPIGFTLTTFISESFLSFQLFHADERFYVFAMKASGLGLTFSWLTP